MARAILVACEVSFLTASSFSALLFRFFATFNNIDVNNITFSDSNLFLFTANKNFECERSILDDN